MTDLLTPVDQFIRAQQELTAVDQFSRLHDGGLAAPSTSSPARAYRDLLPLVGPGAGEQYAFEVDLDACSGCKACVSACHSLNGLDESETWRSVGLLTGSAPAGVDPATGLAIERPVLQTVTTACHHCVDPACLNGCPVDAYDKDPVTGIVWHLDDQCIGCSYCTLMCPYEVPVYDHDRGIVRKCDMCRDRLAEGEAPACVQGCPTEAISITVVSRAELVAEARGTTVRGDDPVVLVPSAAPSSITVPGTRYTSRRRAALVDGGRRPVLRCSRPTPTRRWPSCWCSPSCRSARSWCRCCSATASTSADRGPRASPSPWACWPSGPACCTSVARSTPGEPSSGCGHSWLSREIVAFGLFAAAGRGRGPRHLDRRARAVAPGARRRGGRHRRWSVSPARP